MAKTLIEAYEEMKEGIGYDELIQTLNYYHIEIQRKRIRCPFPGHNDRHIGNCSITDRGILAMIFWTFQKKKRICFISLYQEMLR